MAKRFVDTEIWDKAWYQDLTIKEKILVKYLFENCDYAGVWDINLRMASFIIGESITLTDIYNINNKKELYIFIKDEYDKETKVYIKDFVNFQYGKLSYNCKPHIPVIKLLKKYNIEFDTIDNENLTPKQLRKRLTATAKENIFIRDKYECQYCGSKEELEVDHIVPLINGGTNEDDNLITACHKCNTLKSDKSLEEFIKKHSSSIKFLDRVYKILDTLKEKEQEQEQYKEKEKEKEYSVYGKYLNVCLGAEQYNHLLGICASQKLLDELIDSLSEKIEEGKEKPFMADYPNAHYIRIQKYREFRLKYPDKFRTEQKKSAVAETTDKWYEEMKARGYGS